MSRPRSRAAAGGQTRPTPAPRPAPATPGTVIDAGLSYRVAVDRVLAELAAARAAGESAGPVAEAAAQARQTAAPVAMPLAEAGLPAARAGAPVATPVVPTAPVSTSLAVAGMTCRTCEVRIQRHVGKLPGVERVTASAIRGRVEIASTSAIPRESLVAAIRAAGYEPGPTPWLAPDPTVWITLSAGIGLVGALAVLANLTGLADLASGAGDLASGGIVVALLLGLAAGVSTCAALVGGLVLALSAAFEARRVAAGTAEPAIVARLRPALVFIAGRIAGYGLLGAALGALGASVSLPPQLTAALMIGVAIVMTILGTRLTGLSPRIATWSPTLPLGLGGTLGLTGPQAGGYSDGRAAVLGAASFFLPCGFTQAVQIYALSTGSPLFAGAILAIFALGTAPGLLALAGLPVVVPASWRPALVRVVGVVVLGFALVNGMAGLRLAGIGLPSLGAQAAATVAPPASGAVADGTQALTTFQDWDGYSPGNVAIYAGTPTRWTIESRTTASCTASLVVPSLGIRVQLHKGANTLELPALPAGTLAYSCSMGMFGGSITVVDRPVGG